MRRPQLVRPESHEDAFLARYELLLRWALKLADRDRTLAEDLVQDTFVQFIISKPELRDIDDLDRLCLPKSQSARQSAHSDP
jgi:DNA-directed RNA polymerase specialized sigma24 family protein